MEINRLDAHDRLKALHKTENQINEGLQDCIKNRPKEFGTYPFYVFSHKRTIGIDERLVAYQSDFLNHIELGTQRQYASVDEVPSHRILWQSRLSRPLPQTNSMLFRIDPKRDGIEVCWIIPDEMLFAEYEKGKMMENEIITYSIYLYKTNRKALEEPFPDDVDELTGIAIYKAIAERASKKGSSKLILPWKA